MKVNNIQTHNSNIFRNTNNLYSINAQQKWISSKPQFDTFTLQKNNQPSFTSQIKLTDLIIEFLKNKSYYNSIKGSKRPYLSIEKDLEPVISQIKIKVSKNEEINAWDINPKKSNKYIIFLHGFSQNITSNQKLYKTMENSDFGILAIDYRSYGKNKDSKHITENDIMQDVQASVKYLKNKGINNIGLVGHSFGSYIAAKTSNLNPFNFQILVSPMLSLEFWLNNVLKHPDKYKSERLMIKYIPKFKEQYEKIFDIKKHVEQNHTPTYIVQAQRDKYIKTSKVNEVAKIVPNLKKYTILQLGGHRMDENKIQAIEDILEKL